MPFARIALVLVAGMGLTACATVAVSDTTSTVRLAQTNEVQPRWGFVLSPINVETVDADGTIRIWHSRTGRKTYSTRKACLEAAQDGLKYMAGEAWNLEANCKSPFNPNPLAPVQISGVEVEDLAR